MQDWSLIASFGVTAILLCGCGTQTLHSQTASRPAVADNAIHVTAFRALQFYGAQQGWALASISSASSSTQYVILMTKDGGRHWTPVLQPAPLGSIATADFTSPDHGALVLSSASSARAVAYTTANGGRVWHKFVLKNGLTTGVNSAQINFSSSANGWIALSSTGLGYAQTVLYRTQDGGIQWASLPHPTAWSIFPNGLTAKDTTVWVTGQNHSNQSNQTMMTTDAGGHWFALQVSLPRGVTNADTFPMVVAGSAHVLPVLLYLPQQFGFMLYHQAAGGFQPTTTLAIKTIDPPLNEVLNANQAWVVGRYHLYHTNTGGRSWTPIHQVSAAWRLLDIQGSGIGYAVVQSPSTTPQLLLTTDGGQHWQAIRYVVKPSSKKSTTTS